LRLYSARSRPESINRKRLNRRTDVSYFEKNYNDKPEGKIRTVFDREILEIEQKLENDQPGSAKLVCKETMN